MVMDLRQLAALTAVADHGTFSAAADALHTVQSNVSTHVARLERELGAVLVDRSAGRLTEEGVAVVMRARRIQAELDALTADVASLRDEVAGPVRMGVIGTTGRWLMPPVLSAMAGLHPKVHLTILEGNTTVLLPPLLAGRIDLAILNLPVTDPEVLIEPLFEEDLIVVAPLDHPLASHDGLDLADLAAHDLLLPPPGTSIRVAIDKAATAAGITLTAKAELDGLRLIASLVFEGFGASILPSTAAPPWLEGAWRRIPVTGLPRRHVGVARRRRGMPSAPTRALHDVMIQLVAVQATEGTGIYLPS
jgi:DNA-binding transcriptional LysR family regulator